MIHLRVVSPSDLTSMLMSALRTEQAVMNLTLHSAAASNPDGDAVHFDVLNGAANDVIGAFARPWVGRARLNRHREHRYVDLNAC